MRSLCLSWCRDGLLVFVLSRYRNANKYGVSGYNHEERQDDDHLMELTNNIIVLLHCFDLRLCPTNKGEIVKTVLLFKIKIKSGEE